MRWRFSSSTSTLMFGSVIAGVPLTLRGARARWGHRRSPSRGARGADQARARSGEGVPRIARDEAIAGALERIGLTEADQAADLGRGDLRRRRGGARDADTSGPVALAHPRHGLGYARRWPTRGWRGGGRRGRRHRCGRRRAPRIRPSRETLAAIGPPPAIRFARRFRRWLEL